MKQSARSEAKVSGSLYYFTGKACKYGHVSKRLTSTGQCLECLAIWRTENADRINASRRKYTKNNIEFERECKRQWRIENPEKQRAATAEWARNNPGRVLERTNKWARNNPDKIAIKTARRRARELLAEGHFTVDDIKRILHEQNGVCFYCPSNISDNYTIDHHIPLIRGGTNWPSNIVLACGPCNYTKRDLLPEEFKTYKNKRSIREVNQMRKMCQRREVP